MKNNKIIRNLKYFLPLIVKTSPSTLLFVFLIAFLGTMQSVINIVVPSKIIQYLGDPLETNKIIIYLFILVFSSFIINNLKYYLQKLNSNNAKKTDFLIDDMINQKIMNVDFFKLEDPVFIDEIQKAKKGMSEYTNGIYSILFCLETIIETILSIFSVIGIILLSKNYLIIFVAMIGIIINTLIYHKIQNYDQRFREKTIRLKRYTNYFNNTICSFRMQKDLRYYNGIELVKSIASKKISDSNKEYMKQSKKLGFLYIIDTFSNYYISIFLTIVIMIYSFYNSINILSIASFTLLYNSISVLNNATANFIFALQKYAKSCDYQNDFINLMETESIFKNGNLPISKIETIEFKNVCFKYPRTQYLILDNVSFKIEKGQKVSLVGLNGAGKTTIIKLLCRFYDVDNGEILINGVNIKNYQYDQYMKLLGIVFQDYKIISFSVKQNIAILDDNMKKLYEILEKVKLREVIEKLPYKENTYVNKWFNKNGVEFSGGELQKIALSRTIYKDADFVVLDEPTSALDPIIEEKIYKDFKNIIGNKLTLFISHRLSSCIFSDKILVLDGNKIVQEGSHQELMEHTDGLYFKMFNSQAKYYNE